MESLNILKIDSVDKGVYIDGIKIGGLQEFGVSAEVDALTEVTMRFNARVDGLDYIRKEERGAINMLESKVQEAMKLKNGLLANEDVTIRVTEKHDGVGGEITTTINIYGKDEPVVIEEEPTTTIRNE